MRFHSIELYNIKSLVGRYYLPLEERFGSTELFLIYGPTGVGKTAFFDAVSLALFGKTAQLVGAAKAKDQTRSVSWVKNEACTECSVQVLFSVLDTEHHRQYYRATWALKSASTGSIKNPTRTLEWLDADENVLEELYSGDQAKKAEEVFELVLHGLTFEDFQQTILLPQGAFARFLQSKKDDRVQLLERITGTRHLEDICTLATKTKEEWNRKRKHLLEEVERYDIPTEENVSDYRKEKERCLVRLEEQDRARIALSRIRDFQTKQIQYQQHTQLFQEEKEQIVELRRILDEYKENVIKIQAQTDTAKEALRIFEGHRAKWTLTIETIQERWMALNSQNTLYDSLVLQNQHLERKLQSAKSTIKDSDVEIQATLEQACNHAWTELCKEITFATEENYLAEIAKRRRTFQGKELRCSQIEILEAELQGHQDKLKSITKDGIDNRATQEKNQVELQRLQTELEAQEQERRIHQRSKEKGDAYFMMDTKRKELVDGKECELCGSTSHPYVEKYAARSQELVEKHKGLIRRIQTLDDSISQTREQKIRLEQKIQHQEEALLRKQQEYRDEFEHIKRKKELLRQYLEEIGGEPTEDIRSVQDRLHQDKERLERLNEEVSRTKHRLSQFLQERAETQRIQIQIGELEQQREHRQKEARALQSTISREFEEVLIESTSLSRQVATALAIEIAERESPVLILQQLNQLLLTQEQSRKERLNSRKQELISAQSKVESYAQQIRDREKQIADRKQQFADLEQGLQTGRDQAVQAFSAMQAHTKVLREEVSEELLFGFLENGQELEEQYLQDKALMRSLSEKINRYEQHKDLAEEYNLACAHHRKWDSMHIILNTKRHLVSERTSEMRPVTFREYAQIRQLQLLVQGANEHLLKMETGYQIEVLRDEHNLPTLDFVIREGGKQPRPLHTLSGGQTFLVSLAFSLGLADLRKVYLPIETLLIDEGFGSLDADYVEMVLSTLEQLKERKVQVGLISHVQGVREKISAKVTPLELKIEVD